MAEAGYGPGLFARVTQDGAEVCTAAAGVRDFTDPRPIGVDDRFRIGSITKTFVATVVLQLVGEGRIAVEDPVGGWLPEYPLHPNLTLGHLLGMRSGLPCYAREMVGDPPDWSVYDRYHAPEDLVRLALTLDGQTAPGLVRRHSSTDYLLLGLVVEWVTGQRLDAQVWQRVIAPLRLGDTYFPTVDPTLRGRHATGYVRWGGPYVPCAEVTPSQSWASGAMVSTPADLARFYDALLGGDLLPAAQLAAMRDAVAIDEHHGYGYGLYRFQLDDGRTGFGHRGAAPGYSSLIVRIDDGRTVVLYRNSFDKVLPLPWNNRVVAAALR
ncbi:beta-lactamase family protein [Planosporangium flavigriseum]|uniref:Serine hydrolase n=1 Tax=Planosporangium flavigriseum TaxID=373681 RepID=A0A8J3PM03_9ACTN|nr:serine hydrolase domain-containing protein [Planosporangium flavigriseum]NJC66854.1 beta-lactamase family protein [Planosporangium flavigriseum]GIG74402.1 serine hydrolase [Planosporangium flavigriseum]